jgi:Ca2+-dependent lipid-binding protein
MILQLEKITKPDKSGMISIKLTIHDKTEQGDVDFDYVPAWSMDLPERANRYTGRAFIYQCKGLPSADKDGTSDPYVEVWAPVDK